MTTSRSKQPTPPWNRPPEALRYIADSVGFEPSVEKTTRPEANCHVRPLKFLAVNNTKQVGGKQPKKAPGARLGIYFIILLLSLPHCVHRVLFRSTYSLLLNETPQRPTKERSPVQQSWPSSRPCTSFAQNCPLLFPTRLCFLVCVVVILVSLRYLGCFGKQTNCQIVHPVCGITHSPTPLRKPEQLCDYF